MISCGAQPSSGAACASKSRVVFAQWSTDIWACNWCTWRAALQNHLVFHLWVANCHFRSCIWIFASMDVALRPRASITPSRSWIKGLQLVLHGCQDFLTCVWRWNGGTSWLGLDLAFSRGTWSPEEARCHWPTVFLAKLDYRHVAAWCHHLCFWQEWLRLVSSCAPACVLLVASRLVHLEPSCCRWCREWGQVLLIVFIVCYCLDNGWRLHSHLCCPACADFCPQHELANVKACSVIGAPNNQVWWLTPRGPSLHAIILLSKGHTCVFTFGSKEVCAASLFVFNIGA